MLASVEDLARVHDHDYIEAFVNGTLSPQAIRRIGFPWSAGLVKRTLASAGATLAATSQVVEGAPVAGVLAGGTHHAFRDQGAGYCIFNDIAVSIEKCRAIYGLARFAVIDLDVHQGDGTALIFENDSSVFTLSLHGANNFPFRKQKSSLDVEFPDGITDELYVEALLKALKQVWEFSPQLVFFQSGVDALREDRLGRLDLTLDGLRHRDEAVLAATRQHGVPVVITMGGGYSEPIERTVEAHAQTFRVALSIYRSVLETEVELKTGSSRVNDGG